MSQKYRKHTYIYKKTISALSTGYFTFKGVCSESFQKYCLSAHLQPHFLNVLCLRPLPATRPPPARSPLPPRLRCTPTLRCHSHRNWTSPPQSQSKPRRRGRCSDSVLETGTGLLYTTNMNVCVSHMMQTHDVCCSSSSPTYSRDVC